MGPSTIRGPFLPRPPGYRSYINSLRDCFAARAPVAKRQTLYVVCVTSWNRCDPGSPRRARASSRLVELTYRRSPCPCIAAAPEPRPACSTTSARLGNAAASVLTLPARNECAAASDMTPDGRGGRAHHGADGDDPGSHRRGVREILVVANHSGVATATATSAMCASDHRRTTTRTSAKRDQAVASSSSPRGGRPVLAGHDGCIGSMASRGVAVRRWTHRISDTGAMPSRAAATLTLRDVRIATNRSVAFSISASDVAA